MSHPPPPPAVALLTAPPPPLLLPPPPPPAGGGTTLGTSAGAAAGAQAAGKKRRPRYPTAAEQYGPTTTSAANTALAAGTDPSAQAAATAPGAWLTDHTAAARANLATGATEGGPGAAGSEGGCARALLYDGRATEAELMGGRPFAFKSANKRLVQQTAYPTGATQWVGQGGALASTGRGVNAGGGGSDGAASAHPAGNEVVRVTRWDAREFPLPAGGSVHGTRPTDETARSSAGAAAVPVHSGPAGSTNSSALPPRPSVQVVAGVFTYKAAGRPGASAWYPNFAHRFLFAAWNSSLLAQDELQTLEFPVLAAIAQGEQAKAL